MWGARAQQSGLGGYGAGLLAALLGLIFLLSQHARAAEPTNVTSAANQTTQTMTSTLSEVCGKTKFQGKIYGGQIAGAERWPWQASLRLYGRHICGAVLIDKNWVASAAHCFQRVSEAFGLLSCLGIIPPLKRKSAHVLGKGGDTWNEEERRGPGGLRGGVDRQGQSDSAEPTLTGRLLLLHQVSKPK
ncbi:Serine protease 40 [Apodemus speciosus]|uniref:Serine protease 40 n=1 Tax=Apodemus speciosus TaxID=105296 RepID=A0ABQ0EDE8_APOSI